MHLAGTPPSPGDAAVQVAAPLPGFSLASLHLDSGRELTRTDAGGYVSRNSSAGHAPGWISKRASCRGRWLLFDHNLRAEMSALVSFEEPRALLFSFQLVWAESRPDRVDAGEVRL
jgi:hypothetical protein